MKNLKRSLLAGVAALAISSCTVILPVTVSEAEIGNQKGSSESVVLFGVIYLNKAYGVKDAANNGSITSAIATVDEKTTNFVIFQKKTLMVTAK